MKLRNIRRAKAHNPARRYWGNKCKDYIDECPVCVAHRTFKETGRFPDVFEVQHLLELLVRQKMKEVYGDLL
jgi:hypothetical protein